MHTGDDNNNNISVAIHSPFILINYY